MFSIQERDRVRGRLLELAEADPGVVGAAVTGSHAVGGGDEWSDIDLALAIDGGLGDALGRWTELLRGKFGALHHWDLPSGSTVPPAAGVPPRRDDLIGLGWHHVLHARACIERGQPWQAEYWISGVRDQVLALACRRLGKPVGYAKGADLLPPELTGSLVPTLVSSLEEAELRRALAAAAAALVAELERTDAPLAARLRPILLSASAAGTGR